MLQDLPALQPFGSFQKTTHGCQESSIYSSCIRRENAGGQVGGRRKLLKTHWLPERNANTNSRMEKLVESTFSRALTREGISDLRPEVIVGYRGQIASPGFRFPTSFSVGLRARWGPKYRPEQISNWRNRTFGTGDVDSALRSRLPKGL